jgi:hypothetical protein
MLRTVSLPAGVVRKLLQNLPVAGAIMGAFVAPWLLPRDHSARMKPIVFVLALFIATGVAAQGPSVTPVPGPSRAPAPAQSRNDLWQLLTPEQRDQLWRTLSPEQRSDVWRGLQPHERREMRERLAPDEARGANGPWTGRRQFDRGDGPAGMMKTPEERQQMREQIREAHRLRRERMDAERARRPQ